METNSTQFFQGIPKKSSRIGDLFKAIEMHMFPDYNMGRDII